MTVDEPRYELVIKLEARTADGQPFFENTATWHKLRYGQMVVLEDLMVGALEEAVNLGYGEAVERGADPEEIGKGRRHLREGKRGKT